MLPPLPLRGLCHVRLCAPIRHAICVCFASYTLLESRFCSSATANHFCRQQGFGVSSGASCDARGSATRMLLAGSSAERGVRAGHRFRRHAGPGPGLAEPAGVLANLGSAASSSDRQILRATILHLCASKYLCEPGQSSLKMPCHTLDFSFAVLHPQQDPPGRLPSLAAIPHQVPPHLSSTGGQNFGGGSAGGATPPLGLGGGSPWPEANQGGGSLGGGGQYPQHSNGLGQQGAPSRTETKHPFVL